jgi:hypothetical protein
MEINWKPITVTTMVLCALFAFLTIANTVMMPAAELLGWKITKHVPAPGDSPLLTLPPAQHLADTLIKMGDDACKAIWKKDFATLAKEDPNYQYYAYCLFLGLALIAAGVAIAVVGRLESEERTIIPQK